MATLLVPSPATTPTAASVMRDMLPILATAKTAHQSTTVLQTMLAVIKRANTPDLGQTRVHAVQVIPSTSTAKVALQLITVQCQTVDALNCAT